MIGPGQCYNPAAPMMKTLIALDIETTGLDPERDAVIEIGTVRFQGRRIDGEWQALINPGRPLPAFITQLTGITDEMLADAPRLSRKLPELESFVGDLPILGHSVSFDIGFLKPHGLFRFNQLIDTYDLASVMLPAASRYRLGALAGALGIPQRQSHRALDDAHTTRQVFLRLYQQLLELPPELIREIAVLGGNIEWGAGWLFDEAVRQLPQAALGQKDNHRFTISFSAPTSYPQLEPSDEPVPLNVETIAAQLEPGGPISRAFAEYESRSQQVTMLRAVAQALSEGRHLLVEAGTGTGKSLAYLLPAFAWASLNGERVIISTNTINLQDQLIHKDIPDIQAAVDASFRAAVLKGRANYLCPRRLEGMRRLGPTTAEEMRLLAKLLVWLSQGGTGDRGQINLGGRGEGSAWSRLSSEGEECSLDACLAHTGGACPYYQARRAAESAHIVIVNHALLLADIATGNRVIPEYRRLIVDEAHHLESATTNGLSFEVTQGELARLLRELGGARGGLFGQVLSAARPILQPEQFGLAQKVIEAIADRSQSCIEGSIRLFAALEEFLTRRREGEPVGPYGHQFRLAPGARTLPEWGQIEVVWDDLRQPLGEVIRQLDELGENLEQLASDGSDLGDDLSLAIRGAGRNLAEIFTNLDSMIFEPDPQMIYWIDQNQLQSRLALHAAPLEVGPLIERHLWHKKESVIMTSATLTTSGEFDYIRRRLGADEADELAVGSPFDYENATLLYLINDIPEPGDRHAYQSSVERGLIQICRATHGRALVLFTSYDQLRRTARAISDPLGANGILIYEQGEGASPHALLESFKSSEQAVLLGTRSFWEGIDVPGPALSLLCLIRLPFDVPSDPIFAARSETYEAPFDQYAVPEAILRFRQGFGRLIRTRSDRGVVVSFDRRLISKRYGRAFLDSLPPCTVRAGHLADAPAQAARWLGD
jgi:ATP-dependent DNA helicase DinG